MNFRLLLFAAAKLHSLFSAYQNLSTLSTTDFMQDFGEIFFNLHTQFHYSASRISMNSSPVIVSFS